MPTTLTRACEVLGLKIPALANATDERLEATCSEYKTTQTLAAAKVSHRGTETIYRCKNRCCVLLIVSDPEQRAWTGRGYRVGGYVLRNTVDVRINVSGQGTVVLPARHSTLPLQARADPRALRASARPVAILSGPQVGPFARRVTVSVCPSRMATCPPLFARSATSSYFGVNFMMLPR
jgi:hypothetical protein